MKASAVTLASLFIFIFASYSIFPSFEKSRKEVRSADVKGLTLSPIVLKLMTLEFRSIAADFLFVRASQFTGGKTSDGAAVTKEDWDWLYRNLNAATELDPHFQDPYYLGNGFLTWGAERYEDANRLLQKAVDSRDWDWWFPFLIGFNKFYFQGKNKEGADYLLLAYERPNAWPILPSLAARLYYDDRGTKTAISLLSTILKNTTDEKIIKSYKTRLAALYGIYYLENAALLYEDRIGLPPRNIDVLVEFNIIKRIPRDPYGGKFYIDRDGSIKTTSKLSYAALKK